MRPISQGMWVKDEQGRRGIAALDDVFGPDGKVKLDGAGAKIKEQTFHVVDNNGATELVVYRSWFGLEQARYEDIPASRRDGLSRDEAANRFGYL